QTGDQVRIPPVRLSPKVAEKPSDDSVDRVNSAIIYRDDSVLVMNKPSGMAVHGGSGVSYGVIEALRALFPNEKHLELVHRLDRETSGCLMVARKRSVLKSLHEQLRNNDIRKTYVALVKGQWEGGKTTVEAPLKKNVQRSGERMVQVDPTGKTAQSIFKPVRVFTDTTLVEVELVTGRTHQIRVHAAHVRHPIAGDEKYGQRGFNLTMKQRGLNRLFLHAKSLSFTLPGMDAPTTVVAPLGEELEAVLRTLADEAST
ncbi:MAG: RluA family pseudouridine synthase, partial [Gammaproteobacteria bacterium]